MQANIIEIKAKCHDPEKIKSILEKEKADFKGVDHQVDTYFIVPKGRLKLRAGNIENSLIFYNRPNQAGPKKSEVSFSKLPVQSDVRKVLENALGVKVVVDKMRSISFIDNVKFHIDEVKELGAFVEIEAIDTTGKVSDEKLLAQCQYYLNLFEIKESDLLERSYSDLLLEKTLQ